MIVKLMTEHYLQFLSLKGGCRGSSKSTHVKMSHCWKSHALAHLFTDHSEEDVPEVTHLNLLVVEYCVTFV